VQAFVRAGLSASGKEAKRLIVDGGAKLNDAAISDTSLMIAPDMLRDSVKLSAGKKRHAILRLN
jgi:tyrosyl-tRNA synthetase